MQRTLVTVICLALIPFCIIFAFSWCFHPKQLKLGKPAVYIFLKKTFLVPSATVLLSMLISPLIQVQGLNLGLSFQFVMATERDCDFLTATWSSCVVFSVAKCRTSEYVALAELFYKPTVGPLGWGLLGWRMGIQGSVWQSCWIIHIPPPCLSPFLSAVRPLRPP